MIEMVVIAAAALGATAILCLSVLRGWREWIELRRLELMRAPASRDADEADVGVRIELAAVRERLKKLEAIASGVDI